MAESFKARRRESPGRRKRTRKIRIRPGSRPPYVGWDPLQSLVCAALSDCGGRKRERGSKRREGGSGEHFDFPCGVAENGWMGKRGGGTCVQGGFFQSIPSERSQPPLALLFCRDFFRKRAVLQFTLAWGRGFFCGGESRSIPIKDSKHSSFP